MKVRRLAGDGKMGVSRTVKCAQHHCPLHKRAESVFPTRHQRDLACWLSAYRILNNAKAIARSGVGERKRGRIRYPIDASRCRARFVSSQPAGVGRPIPGEESFLCPAFGQHKQRLCLSSRVAIYELISDAAASRMPCGVHFSGARHAIRLSESDTRLYGSRRLAPLS